MRRFFERRNRRSDIDTRLRAAMTALRPLLPIEAAHLELDRYDAATGVAHLRVIGDCPDCDMRAVHFISGIEARLRQAVPELQGVELIDEFPANDA